jgi:ADP-heptose:LPS heptosyltransferase
MTRLTGTIGKIAIFRALYLGDMLCAVPAIRALRKAFPRAEITLIGLPWAEEFTRRFSAYIDRFVVFPGYPGLPEQQPVDQAALSDFITRSREYGYDLALQMQGNGTVVNELIFALNARLVAGFFIPGTAGVSSPYFIRYPEGEPELCRHLALLAALGIAVDGEAYLEFPVSGMDRSLAETLFHAIGEAPFVCIHPGSRSPARRWPPKYFAALADYCAAKGYTVVVTGTLDERPISRELRKSMRAQAIDLTGMTSLGTLAVLISESVLLIANCTGVSHVADATGTRSLIISMDGEPGRWSPLDRKLHRVHDWNANPDFGSVFQELTRIIDEQQLQGAGLTQRVEEHSGKCREQRHKDIHVR